MKILFVTNLYPSSLEPNRGVFIQNQARALNHAGYNICILQLDYRSILIKRKYGIVWRKEEGLDVCHLSIPMSPFCRVKYLLSGLFTDYGYNVIVKRFGRPDIIHGHFLEGSYGLRYIRKKYNIPVIITEHGSNIFLSQRTKFDEKLMNKLYPKVDQVILVSNAQKLEAYNLPINNPIVVYNVIPNYFTAMSDIKKSDVEYTFISVGNLISSKRFDLLIDAFSRIHKIIPQTRLQIVGTGKLMDRLKEQSKKLQCCNAIDFLGAKQNREMVYLYNKANCFVLPSQFETFGMVYAEALCSGIPIIATKNGGAEEIFGTGFGYIINRDNIDELENAMLKIIGEDYSERELSYKNKNRFGEKQFVDKISRIYKKVV